MGAEYVRMSAGTHGGQRKASCLLELELVSHLKWVLGEPPRLLTPDVSAVDFCAVSVLCGAGI